LFIRRGDQISRKIRGIRVTARFLQNWTLSGLAHRRAGPQGGVYERLTPREQKIADIETAKFIEGHGYRDALRDTEMSGEMVRALGGWSNGGNTADNYGSGFTPERLYSVIQAVRYEGLDLSHLYLP
jgi:hypothetical protein